ncbi:MAG: hypothetical protein JJU11_00560 [Candidatus Sumerlaeia bacterium]|nr:hypothetical protein [Candidatus Sumerlaeia bacterium]
MAPSELKKSKSRSSSNGLAATLPQGVAMAHRLHLAVLKAVHRHKVNGNSVAVWRNGEVVLVSPENIQVSPRSFDPVGV